MPIAIILLLAIVTGGGASFAAENALPGDALYPVKVKFNEEVRARFALSQETKATVDAWRAERRLEEAEKLAVKGKMDADARAEIEENFEEHAERVHERIAEFESRENLKAAAEITSNFETALRAHERILLKLATDREETSEEISEIAVKVRARADKVAKSRAAAEVKISGAASEGMKKDAEEKLEDAEDKIAGVRRFLERMETFLGAEVTMQAEARLKVAEQMVAGGRVKLAAEAYGEAFALFQKAHRIAQEAKLLVTARKRFEIDLRINGHLDADYYEDTDEKETPTATTAPRQDERKSGTSVEGEAKVEVRSDATSTETEGRLKIDLGL